MINIGMTQLSGTKKKAAFAAFLLFNVHRYLTTLKLGRPLGLGGSGSSSKSMLG